MVQTLMFRGEMILMPYPPSFQVAEFEQPARPALLGSHNYKGFHANRKHRVGTHRGNL